MIGKKKLTFTLMDAPFENARTVTGLRLIDIAARRGHDVTVFAYEGAVSLTNTSQSPHLNSVHGHNAIEEDHPLPHSWVQSIMKTARDRGGKVDWINCGLSVSERGVLNAVQGARRGTPADLLFKSTESDSTLIIATK